MAYFIFCVNVIDIDEAVYVGSKIYDLTNEQTVQMPKLNVFVIHNIISENYKPFFGSSLSFWSQIPSVLDPVDLFISSLADSYSDL